MLIETVQLSTYYAKNILAFFIFLCYSFFEVNFMENASVIAIVNALKELYPDGVCSLQYKKDYELLFAVRLSA